MEGLAAQPIERNQEPFDREERLRNDTTTWLAETLHGSMRTNFEFRFDGVELYGEDGGALGEVFDDAIETAEAIVSENPNLLFELRRRLIEREEYEDMIAMANGEAPNTMVVISDYPPELMPADDSLGGYNGRRKQTMMRIIAKQDDGSIKVTTQSLDGSNRQGLEAIYDRFGIQPMKGELLGQRIKLDMPQAWQAYLADSLRNHYDASLTEQFGGAWHAGIRQDDARERLDTHEFARHQTDLIEWFVQAKLADPVGAEDLRYMLAATAHKRYERLVASGRGEAAFAVMVTDDELMMYREIEMATAQAQLRGDDFSGCGVSVSAQDRTRDQLENSGYGNKADKSTSYKFDRKMHCVVCQPNPKKNEAKKLCGPCGICRGCDKKMGSTG